MMWLIEHWRETFPGLMMLGTGLFNLSVSIYFSCKIDQIKGERISILKTSVSELEEFLYRSHKREENLQTQICLMDANHKLIHRRMDA